MDAGGEEKPPVLRVKRGAKVLDEGPPPPEPGPPPRPGSADWRARPARPGRGVWRRPGRLGRFSTVAALALVGLAMLFILRVQPRVSSRGTVAGYRAELRAVAVGGFLSASVTLVGAPSRTGERAQVRFSVPDSGREAVAEGELSGVTILSARLPASGAETRVLATLRIGGEEKELEIRLPVRRGRSLTP